MQFVAFPKIPRLNRDIIITEKIDGTNASVFIVNVDNPTTFDSNWNMSKNYITNRGPYFIYAGSRKRWITPESDNFGFAKWVKDNAEDLFELGEGHHFGEWWGQGIQRGYGLKEKRFSLFNIARWGKDAIRPKCCHVVPALYTGPFDQMIITRQVELLARVGSFAAPGFKDPEGVIIYHVAGNHMYKVTCKDDEKPKMQSVTEP